MKNIRQNNRKDKQGAQVMAPHLAQAEILQELNGAKTIQETRRALAIAKLFGSAKPAAPEKVSSWSRAKKVLLHRLPPKTSVLAASFVLLWAVIGLSSSFGQWGNVAMEKYSAAVLLEPQTKNEYAVLGEQMFNLNPFGQDAKTTVIYYHAPKYTTVIARRSASDDEAIPSQETDCFGCTRNDKDTTGEVLGAHAFSSLAAVSFGKLPVSKQKKIQDIANLLLAKEISIQADASVAANPIAENINNDIPTDLHKIITAKNSQPTTQLKEELEDGLGNEYLITHNAIGQQVEQVEQVFNNINFIYAKAQVNIANGFIAVLNNYSGLLARLAFKTQNLQQQVKVAYQNEIAGINLQEAGLAMAVQSTQQTLAEASLYYRPLSAAEFVTPYATTQQCQR